MLQPHPHPHAATTYYVQVGGVGGARVTLHPGRGARLHVDERSPQAVDVCFGRMAPAEDHLRTHVNLKEKQEGQSDPLMGLGAISLTQFWKLAHAPRCIHCTLRPLRTARHCCVPFSKGVALTRGTQAASQHLSPQTQNKAANQPRLRTHLALPLKVLPSKDRCFLFLLKHQFLIFQWTLKYTSLFHVWHSNAKPIIIFSHQKQQRSPEYQHRLHRREEFKV